MPRNVGGQLTSEQINQADFENLIDKIISGEISATDARRVTSKIDVGESYDDAFKGWSRFFQRTFKRGQQLPQTIAKAAEGGFGLEHLQNLTKEHGVGLGTAVWGGEILHGSTIGMAQMAWELLLGHGDLVDGLEIAATVIPTTRLVSSAKAAGYLKNIKNADPTIRAKVLGEANLAARQKYIDAVKRGDRTPVEYQTFKVGGKDGIEITPEEFATLQRYGAIDRTLNYAEWIAEGTEILFNPDELLQTATFAGVMRGLNRIIRPGQPETTTETAPDALTDETRGALQTPPTPPLTPEGQAVAGQTPGEPASQQPVSDLPSVLPAEPEPIVTPPSPTTIPPGTDPVTQTIIEGPPATAPEQPTGTLPPDTGIVTPKPALVTDPPPGTPPTVVPQSQQGSPPQTPEGQAVTHGAPGTLPQQPVGALPAPTTTGTPTTGTATTGTETGGTPTTGTPTTGLPTTGVPTTGTQTTGTQTTEQPTGTPQATVEPAPVIEPATPEQTQPTPEQTATETPTQDPTAPDAGRVVEIPSVEQDRQRMFYYQDPQNPGDVTVMHAKKVRDTNQKEISDRIYKQNKALYTQIAEYVQDPTEQKSVALQKALIREHGRESATERFKDIERWRYAKQGKTEQYTIEATRDGYHDEKIGGVFFNPKTDNWVDTLQNRLPNVQWRENPDFVRPKESPITRAKQIIRKTIDDAHVVYHKKFPPQTHDPILTDQLPTEETLIGNQTVETELLGMAQSLELGKPVEFRGRKVTSLHELAAISQLARDHRVELGYTLYVDANGVVVAQDVMGVGLSSSVIFPDGYLGTIKETLEQNPDVAKVYMMHQHPSGISTPSFTDARTSERMLKELGEKWGSMLIHDGGTYSGIIDKKHYLFDVELTPEERGWEQDPATTATIADERLRTIMGQKFQGVIDEIQNLKTETGKITFIGLDVPHAGAFPASEQINNLTVHNVWTMSNMDKVDLSNPGQLQQFQNLMLRNLKTQGGTTYVAFYDDPNIELTGVLEELSATYGVDIYSSEQREAGVTDTNLANIQGVVKKEVRKEDKAGQPSHVEIIDNLTYRRLVDPRNGYSPQTKDTTDYNNQLERLRYSVRSRPQGAREGVWNPVIASIKSRLANIHHDDIVMVIGNNEADIAFAHSRIAPNGDTVSSDNVFHIDDFDGNNPHVVLAQDIETITELESAMDILQDSGRMVLHVDPSLLEFSLDSNEILGKYSLVRAFEDLETKGIYAIIDKEKPYSTVTRYTENLKLDSVENVRNKRIPIERRDARRLAVSEQSGTSTTQQTFIEPAREKRGRRGIGEPGEVIYPAPLETGDKIDYLLSEDPDGELADTRESERGTGVPAPIDANTGRPVSNEPVGQGDAVANAANQAGVLDTSGAALEQSGDSTASGLRQERSLLQRHQRDRVGSGLQHRSVTDQSNSRAVREERRRSAPTFSASNGVTPKTRIRETAFGEETYVDSELDSRLILEEQGSLDDLQNAKTPEERERAATKITDETNPTQRMRAREKFGDLHDKWKHFFKNSRIAYQILQTGNKALSNMGKPGTWVISQIKKVDENSRRLHAEFDLLLNAKFRELNETFIDEIRERTNAENAQAAENWLYGELVAATEKTREVHPEIQKAADEISEFMDKYFTQGMLDMNYDILADSIIGDLPVEWVDGSTGRDMLLRNRARTKKVGKELPKLTEFLREKRNVERIVLDVEKQQVYAIVEETKTRTREGNLVTAPEYTLVSATGHEVALDAKENLPFSGQHQILATIQDGQWAGNLEGAERMWNAQVSNTPSPEMFREGFDRIGLTLPDDFQMEYKKFGDLDEWNVLDENGKVLYKLRYLTNNDDGSMNTHSMYDDFRHRLMVLEPGAHDPVMIYKGTEASHLWSPIANYYPHMVNWNDIDFENKAYDDLDQKSKKYATDFFMANKDKFKDIEQATEVLAREQILAKSKRYGHLEQARIYDYPEYLTNYFEVLQTFSQRAAERMHVIKNFGQNFDLLRTTMSKLMSPVELRGQMTPKLQAIIKLRQAVGYKDFTNNRFAVKTGNAFLPEDDKGNANPLIIDTNSDKFRHLTVEDWQALIDNGLITELSDGQYQINANNVHQLEMTDITDPVMRQAVTNMSIVNDVIERQYGLPNMSIWEEDMNKVSRAMREATGLFLTKSWTHQIAQLANTVLYTGFKTIPAYFKTGLEFHRAIKEGRSAEIDWAYRTGGVPIDVTQWYSSQTKYTNFILAPRTDFHLKGTGLRNWVKNRLSTPFMALEKMNRIVSAMAGRDSTMANLKRIIEDPNDRVALAELEHLSPYPDHLNRKLGDVLERVKRLQLKVEDIDAAMEMSPEQIKNERPELEVVQDYINSAARAVADLTQHRLTPVERIRAISTNPILKVAFSLQSFMLKQTEFAKNLIAREFRIVRDAYWRPAPSGVAPKTLAAARGIMSRGLLGRKSIGLLPRVLLGGMPFGFTAIMLGNMVRGKNPGEDLNLLAGFYQIALAGWLVELFRSRQYPAGPTKFVVGPLISTLTEGFQDPVKAAGRIANPPIGGNVGSYFRD